MKKLYLKRDGNSVLSRDGRKNECKCLIILKLEQQALCLFLTSIFEVEVEVELENNSFIKTISEDFR